MGDAFRKQKRNIDRRVSWNSVPLLREQDFTFRFINESRNLLNTTFYLFNVIFKNINSN